MAGGPAKMTAKKTKETRCRRGQQQAARRWVDIRVKRRSSGGGEFNVNCENGGEKCNTVPPWMGEKNQLGRVD